MPHEHPLSSRRWPATFFATGLICSVAVAGCADESTITGPSGTIDSVDEIQVDTAVGAGMDAADGASPPCTTAYDCAKVEDPCLVAACQASVGCVVVHKIDGAICDDGDVCSGIGACANGKCAPGAATKCDDKNPCTKDSCQPAKGCQHSNVDGIPCDDGDLCSQGEICAGGACQGGKSVCQCKLDSDCIDIGDLCQPWYCDVADPGAPVCKPNPAKKVACSKKGDTACIKNTCNPNSGQCVMTALVETDTKIACEDGNACTTGDHCVEGECVSGTDTCGCQSHADCAGQDDGNLCNGTLFCNKGKTPAACEFNPASVVTCPTVDNTGCSNNACNPKTGACQVVAVNEAKGCDDGNPCTAGSACKGGACVASTNTCVCEQDSDCAAKDDGDLCNGTLFCDKNAAPFSCKLNPATVISCASVDDTPCLVNKCDAKSGDCAFTAVGEGKPCDDGNSCTKGEVCGKGQCKADDNANTCECQTDADCKSKDDGNLCNGSLFCDKTGGDAVCQVNPATIIKCSDSFDTICSQNTCVPKFGSCSMQVVNSGQSCDDGLPCTTGEFCAQGKCGGGKDLCGCHNDLECAGQEDGNACNGTLYCDKATLPWSCKLNPASIIKCPSVDDTFCMARKCLPKSGDCQFVAINQGIACKDASACTEATVCKNGACTGAQMTCDDGVDCTADSCDDITGCTFTPQAALCDDGDPCTDDACLAGKGCQHKHNKAPCDDADACSEKDTCVLGKCVGAAVVCDDDNPCTDDPCDIAKGCLHPANSAPCATGEKCKPLGTCTAGACVADQTQLFSATYDGVKDDSAAGLFGLAKGDVVVAGTTWSKGAGKADVWLRRVSQQGKSLWDVTVGGAGDEVAAGVVATSDEGGVVVGSIDPGLKGGSDAWIMRFGVDAAVQYKQVAGEEFNDAALGVSLFGKDELIVAGRLGTSDSDSQLWLLRLSNVGAILWQGTYAGSKGEATAAVPLGDGYALTGSVLVGKARVLAAVRTDGQGKAIWHTNLDGLPGRGESLAASPDGGLLVAGSQGVGPDDARLVRFDGAGKVVWDKLYGGAGKGAFTSLQRRPDGSLALAGLQEQDKAMKLWLLRLDGQGKSIWQRQTVALAAGARPQLAVLADLRHAAAATVDGAAGQGTAIRLDRTDFWGYADCESQGECATKHPWPGKDGCDDANPCTNDTCIALLGCNHAVNTVPCDDGDVCTEGDTCVTGTCTPLASGDAKCDDGNSCSLDVCDVKAGCKHSDLSGACDDGNACTDGDTCSTGLCKPGAAVVCDDGNGCTDDFCDVKAGCSKETNIAPCSSGSCTWDDACDGGFCKSSGKLSYTGGWYGSAFADHALGVAAVGNQGFVLAGRTYKDTHPDGLVVRVDPQGKELWKTQMTGPIGCCGGHSTDKASHDHLMSILPTPFGFLAVGQTSLCANKGWIVRLDHSGKVVWSKVSMPGTNCGGAGHAQVYYADIEAGHDGTYGIAGLRINYPYPSSYHRGQFSRIDKDGKLLNQVAIYNGYTRLYGIGSAEGSGYAVAGLTNYTGVNKSWDGFVARLNSAGGVIWTRRHGYAKTDQLYDIARAADGGYFAVGFTNSKGAGGDDGWVVRLASDGSVLWDQTYGGAANDHLRGLSVVAGDKLAAAGETYSKGPGGADIWMLGLGATGTLDWEKVHGNPKDDVASGVARMDNGALALGGYSFAKNATSPSFRLLVTDAFGNASCADGGACHALDAPTCDDLNPCTSDGCDAKSGCVHQKLADGTGCGGLKKCAAGVCK